MPHQNVKQVVIVHPHPTIRRRRVKRRKSVSDRKNHANRAPNQGANRAPTQTIHIANPMAGLHAQMAQMTQHKIENLEKEVSHLRAHQHHTAQNHVAKAIHSLPPVELPSTSQVVHSMNEYDARLSEPVLKSSSASIIDNNSNVMPVRNIPDAFTSAQFQHNFMLQPDMRLTDPFQRDIMGIKMSLSNDVNHHYPNISTFSQPATHMTEERLQTQDISPDDVQRAQYHQEAERARQMPSLHYMEADYKIRTKPTEYGSIRQKMSVSQVPEQIRTRAGYSYPVKSHQRERVTEERHHYNKTDSQLM